MHTEVRPCKNPTIPLSPSFILTGATGYLGIHLLHELLATLPQTKVLCIVRAADEEKARMRLAETYRHYFPDAPVLEEVRVKAIPGDITSPELFSHLSLLTPHPSLFIHCAADVRYFAPHEEIERTNIEGTRLVAAFCREHAIRLVHISTLSVLQHRFTSSYIESKRQAEQWVRRLCCVSGGPVTAQILRIGFLAPRSTDGMFQRNPDRSAFFSLLQWLRQMDCFPTSMAKMQPDVMPIDQAARLILHHALHPNPSEDTINLTHPTPLSSLLPHVTEVSDTEFLCRLNQHPEPPIAVRTWMNILFEEKYSDKN
jgi:thioester reductase-like protein